MERIVVLSKGTEVDCANGVQLGELLIFELSPALGDQAQDEQREITF